MAEALATSYDELPYTNHPFHQTHPSRLAATATVFGMRPAPVERCRVLELGCAAGGNLIPLAQTFPGSRFVGIDLSPRQVADGQAVIGALGLSNIELKALNLLEVDAGFGRFDYLICHGVYSWVPPAVQDKILAICRDNLADAGVAYVSYNLFPGWHAGAMIREMLGFHVRPYPDRHEQVRQARGLLDFLVGAVADEHAAYRGILREEADRLRALSDSYLFHEYLEDENRPVYFHAFAQRAAAHGLQYLAEAGINAGPGGAGQGGADWPEDLLEREHYYDQVHCRTFRRSLLCHAGVSLTRPPDPGTVTGLYAGALSRPAATEPDCRPGRPEEFLQIDGKAAFTTADPVAKAALTALYEVCPRALGFNTLTAAVRARLGDSPPGPDEVPGRLARFLLSGFLANLVELHTQASPFVVEVSDRPTASPLARFQAQADAARVTNLRHRQLAVDAADRLVLCRLDGSRDRAALLDLLEGLVADGTLVLDAGGPSVLGREQVRAELGRALEACLRARPDSPSGCRCAMAVSCLTAR
jgi:methyltransferase-like protein/SAM-dependent methyltransferase